MEAIDILKQAFDAGVELKVINGTLKGRNLKVLDTDIRQAIRGNKAEIISLLGAQSGLPSINTMLEIVSGLKPCPLCHGRDFIHGHKGGYFCIICQPSARPGDPVKAGGYRAKNANDTKM